MKLADNVIIGGIFCISLTNRKNKRRKMNKHLRKRKISVQYFYAEPHKNPRIGCLESHLEILRIAKMKKLNSVMILEDDARIAPRSMYIEKSPPDDWEMIYLGGNVQQLLNDENVLDIRSYWKRVRSVSYTHLTLPTTPYV